MSLYYIIYFIFNLYKYTIQLTRWFEPNALNALFEPNGPIRPIGVC